MSPTMHDAYLHCMCLGWGSPYCQHKEDSSATHSKHFKQDYVALYLVFCCAYGEAEYTGPIRVVEDIVRSKQPEW
jgi:hypothetical protein